MSFSVKKLPAKSTFRKESFHLKHLTLDKGFIYVGYVKLKERVVKGITKDEMNVTIDGFKHEYSIPVRKPSRFDLSLTEIWKPTDDSSSTKDWKKQGKYGQYWKGIVDETPYAPTYKYIPGFEPPKS